MSELNVTTVESTQSLTTNGSITVGPTTINSTSINLQGSNGVINTTAVKVTSASGDKTIAAYIQTPSITINNTELYSLITESVNTQVFTVAGSNTWTKPSWANTGNELVMVHLWGGGGGGTGNSTFSLGGGGGAHVFGYFKSSQVNTVCNVVVGVAGIGNTLTSTSTNGGNTIFYANTTNSLIAYGGGSAGGSGAAWNGGSGGGWLSAGSNTSTTGGPLGGNSTIFDSTFGGGIGSTNLSTRGGASVYGGGGGVHGGAGIIVGTSVYGGGGGCVNNAAALSVYGGRGGNSSVAATAPAGGGGANAITGGAGARGEVRIYTYRITGNSTTTYEPTAVRYVRWVITAVRSPGNGIQASEFCLQLNSADISGMSSATVSTTATAVSGELVPNLVDGNVATKWYTGDAAPVTISFDLGSAKSFNGYRWSTANDQNPRDPISWQIYTSTDGVNYTLVHTVTSATITTSRNTNAGSWSY